MINDAEELIHISQNTMKNLEIINDYINNTVIMMNSE